MYMNVLQNQMQTCDIKTLVESRYQFCKHLSAYITAQHCFEFQRKCVYLLHAVQVALKLGHLFGGKHRYSISHLMY